MTQLDQISIVPLYKQLKDRIKTDIKNGVLKPNQRIPTEQELSQTYHISRMTVRNAIAELVDEEILAKKQGKGTFVLEPKMTEDLLNCNSFTNLCKRNGKVPGGKTVQFVMKDPTERDVEELKLQPGERVIDIERLRYADGIPVMLENLFFPGHLEAILTENLDDISLYQILQNKYSLRSGGATMQIEISEASGYEAAMLDVKAGSPLLLVREIVYDQHGAPFHRTKSLLRGDKIKYIRTLTDS